MGTQFSNQAEADGMMMGSHLKTPCQITKFPYFPGGTGSLLSKVLTRDVWDACKDKKDKYGYTFQQCIFSGCKWTESGIGVYAGCHEGYYTFAPLFDKIIQQYHKHGKNDKHISNMDHRQLRCPDFPADEDAMINSTRIRVGRNLADYPLGTAITKQQRLEVESKVVSALSTFTGELKGKYYSLSSMTEAEKNQLI
jgi:creatine kinase/arginine kinase